MGHAPHVERAVRFSGFDPSVLIVACLLLILLALIARYLPAPTRDHARSRRGAATTLTAGRVAIRLWKSSQTLRQFKSLLFDCHIYSKSHICDGASLLHGEPAGAKRHE